MLLELAPPSSMKGRRGEAWEADIPLHLRYLEPGGGGQENIELPWPVVFWACPAEEGTKMSTNPFDRVSLGYEGLFGPRTMFYHLTPQTAQEKGSLVENLQVPVIGGDQAATVEIGTVVMITLGTLWILAKLVKNVAKGPVWFGNNEDAGQVKPKAKRL